MDEAAVAGLFVAAVTPCVADKAMFAAPLLPGEALHVSKAIPARRREFAAGRAAAREALRRAGGFCGAIVAEPDRSPRWPLSFHGSITHCEGFCCAVVARSSELDGLGLDAEMARPLGSDVHHLVCTPSDAAHFAGLPVLHGVDWPKLAFSAKEAFYKCYYPITRTFLAFRDVSVFFSPDDGDTVRGTFSVRMESGDKPQPRSAQDFIGRWLLVGETVYTGVTLPLTRTAGDA